MNGTVSRREDKRRAEDIVEDISGVKHVQNNLRVQQQTSWSGGNGTSIGSAGSTTAASTTGSASGLGGAGAGTGSASATATGAKDTATKDRANTAPT